MRHRRCCLPVTCSFALGMTVASSSSALASEGGHVASARVSETSYRHYFDDMLYAHEGDDRGWPDGAQHHLARDNIAMLLTSFGLDVTLHEFTFIDSPGYNVVATKAGTTFPEQEYLVGAHYDSVSNPGADDNASGVALLLETARVLSAYESEYTIRFVAFDAEEWVVVGSTAYVLDHAGDDILGVINADMVAFSNGENHMRVCTHPDHGAFRSAIGAAVDTYGGGMTWTGDDKLV